jgi:hypothetical protein
MKEKLLKLIDLKSIITILIVGVFVIQIAKGYIPFTEYKEYLALIIGTFFGAKLKETGVV